MQHVQHGAAGITYKGPRCHARWQDAQRRRMSKIIELRWVALCAKLVSEEQAAARILAECFHHAFT